MTEGLLYRFVPHRQVIAMELAGWHVVGGDLCNLGVRAGVHAVLMAMKEPGTNGMAPGSHRVAGKGTSRASVSQRPKVIAGQNGKRHKRKAKRERRKKA